MCAPRDRHRRTVRRRAGRARQSAAVAHREGRAAVARTAPSPAARPVDPPSRRRSRSWARWDSRWASCSAAPRRSTKANRLRGLAASGGVYEGPARRVSGPADFDRIKHGDVLVTEATTEAFNVLLPLLGAIVTDSGGLLSHSAIVAREYGIPGVVGTRNATAAHRRRRAGAGRRRRRCRDGLLVTEVVPLVEAEDDSRFGAKATGLGSGGARRPARSLPASRCRARSSTPSPRARTRRSSSSWSAARPLRGPLAVRSSAADEDGADASFAGQHLTLLNVPSVDDLSAAIREIWWSANSDSAITYRQRVGPLPASEHRRRRPVAARSRDVAGVMFTQNPINGADERMIEASWGLGEAVVSGV